jgi:hypothetical protein
VNVSFLFRTDQRNNENRGALIIHTIAFYLREKRSSKGPQKVLKRSSKGPQKILERSSIGPCMSPRGLELELSKLHWKLDSYFVLLVQNVDFIQNYC